MLKNDKYYQNFFLIAADKYNFNFPIYNEEIKNTNESSINDFFFLMSFFFNEF